MSWRHSCLYCYRCVCVHKISTQTRFTSPQEPHVTIKPRDLPTQLDFVIYDALTLPNAGEYKKKYKRVGEKGEGMKVAVPLLQSIYLGNNAPN